MIRVNSMNHCYVRQEISYNFETQEITHIVTYSNSYFHSYEKLEFPNFKIACIAFESLERLAKQIESDLELLGKV